MRVIYSNPNCPNPARDTDTLVGEPNLQHNFAIELRVLRQINFAHSAFANLRADFIAAELCVGG